MNADCIPGRAHGTAMARVKLSHGDSACPADVGKRVRRVGPDGWHGTGGERARRAGSPGSVCVPRRWGEYSGRAHLDWVEWKAESATEKDMEIRGPVGDWHALKSNPGYKADWRAHDGAPPVVESAGFALRGQSEADLEAARWGLLAWVDPKGRSRFKPFWIDEKMLMAVVVEPGDTAGMQSVPESAGAASWGIFGTIRLSRQDDRRRVCRRECR